MVNCGRNWCKTSHFAELMLLQVLVPGLTRIKLVTLSMVILYTDTYVEMQNGQLAKKGLSYHL